MFVYMINNASLDQAKRMIRNSITSRTSAISFTQLVEKADNLERCLIPSVLTLPTYSTYFNY